MQKNNALLSVLGCVLILGSSGPALYGVEVSGSLFYGKSWAFRDLKESYDPWGFWIYYSKGHLDSLLGGNFRLAGPRFGILVEYYKQSMRKEFFSELRSGGMPPQIYSNETQENAHIFVLAAEYQILPFSKKWLPFIGAGILFPFRINIGSSDTSPGMIKSGVLGRLGVRWRPVGHLGVLATMDYWLGNSILVFKAGLEIWL